MDNGILYLAGSDVLSAMPPIAERIELAERALVALVSDAEMPPKIGVHPRPEGSFAHAMPAMLRPSGDSATSADDLLGIKWVAGFPGVGGAGGRSPINALVIVNDAATGLPTAILDGGAITAHRTAAVSGVVVSRWAPRVAGRSPRATIVGAGVQGRSHMEMLAYVLPGVTLTVHDRHQRRAEALAEMAASMPGIGDATAATGSAQEAVWAADVVITAVTFARPEDRQQMTPDWLAPDALVVAVDYATLCSAATARDAGLFLTDDRGQFLTSRDQGQFDDYPDPTATIGEAVLAATPGPSSGRVVAGPSSGRVVAVPLGIGLADIVFAAAIVARARAAGLGTVLPR